MTVRRRATAAAAGVIADLLLGEPAIEPHPVAAFGSWMERLERRTYRDDRAAGATHLALGVGTAWTIGTLVPSTALATYVATAGTMLRDTAMAIGAPLAAGDLDAARLALPALVGREPTTLDATGIARAVVESVAENTTDAVVAPAVWGTLAGAPGALAYRAVNTLDAMVGHHTERYEHFGWASAKADDALNWLPGRLTAGLVAASRPRRARHVLAVVRRDGRAHPSPNAGMAESAFAAALGIRLGGVNHYAERTEERPVLGAEGDACTGADIARACVLSRDCTLALTALLFAFGS